jgi:hypothetical protein
MLYKQASQNLVSKSIDVFCKPKLQKDFRQNMTSVLEFTAKDFFNRIRSCEGLLNRLEVLPYLISLKKPLRSQKGSNLYWHALISWGCIGVRMLWWLATKFDFRVAVAQTFLKLRRMCHSFLGHREKGSGA